MSAQRLDVRRMLLRRGWEETQFGLLRRGKVDVSYSAADVFVTGPARRGAGWATADFPSSVPARVIVAMCEAWAGPGGADPKETRP